MSGAVMHMNHFSTYERLIKSTAYILLFLGKLKNRVANRCTIPVTGEGSIQKIQCQKI